MTSKKNILFVHYGENWIRGSEKCLIDLVNNIDHEKFNILVWSNNKKLLSHIEQRGFLTVESSFSILLGWGRRRFDVFGYAHQLYRCWKLIKEYHVDIIHCNGGAPNQWVIPIAKLLKIPVVSHLHSPYLLRDRLSLFLHQASISVGVSRYVVENILDDGVTENRVRVISNGVEIDHSPIETYSLRSMLKIPSDAFVFVSIGSLIKRKGMDIVINAFNKACDANNGSGRELHLIIIGSGPEQEQLKALSKDNFRCIHLVGEVNNASRLLYRDANAYVSGAREEAFGLVFVEAGVASVPVIAPNTGGIKDIVHHGSTGVLYEPENISQLTRAMLTLSGNKVLCQFFSERAYRRCTKYFGLKRYVSSFEKIYDEVTDPSFEMYLPGPFFCRGAIRKLFDSLLNTLVKNRRLET